MKTVFSKIMAAALCLLAAGVQAGEVRERFEKNCPLSPGGSFSLENTNGAIEIVAWDRNEVQIVAQKLAQARRQEDAQKLLAATEIIVRQEEYAVAVETRTPRVQDDDDTFWRWIFGEGNGSVTVTYQISLPRQIQIKIQSVNGQIEARAISGNIRLATTNGSIAIDDARGSISAKTTNGRLRIAMAQVEREATLDFETTNGSITVEFPGDCNASISARTTNGRVDCDFPLTRRSGLRRNELHGQIGEDGGRVNLRTTNGAITILKRS
ncbi:MAG: DUF4097 domain-containing protein [candidate division KSB1 bacterium]|nr:DUF4097 domain-containing protein [candidate division KSB1 bacterium]MDZ7272807.1 DUF4097 domain-containing protein [candidate division KSB1 bacterium]MDZ7284169.1 DUF4097 domain-containing protein [candidate division KSB1 bacterium]MDZ7297433.1 DUF4097 domain-containing protein [candidate division KSB1 bacterium]MDZ7308181.1 DUF4097 domain-containing protein [candidate division KSB1 bacterium]